jgi:two-component system, chemotaxis family, response regulator Rcp1
MQNNRICDILLIEDNPGDILLITDLFKDNRKNLEIHVARDGVDASRYLLQQDEFKDAPRPGIIILDLNLPRKDGRELLAEIKSEPTLRRIPVIVLSGSNAPQDIAICYDLCANCYIVKPLDLEHLSGVIRSVVDFWLTWVQLPGHVEGI